MRRISSMLHRDHSRADFGEGDHQEYVESGTRDIALIAGAAMLLIGGFVASLL